MNGRLFHGVVKRGVLYHWPCLAALPGPRCRAAAVRRRRFSSGASADDGRSDRLPNNLSRLAFSITSYFRLPEQGMMEYEVLSRSSAFVTPRIDERFPRRWHVLAPAHVTHPWLYRKFYPGAQFDWLDFVHDEAVVNKLGLREESTGRLLHEFVLAAEPRRHQELDLVVLHLNDEAAYDRHLAGMGRQPEEVALSLRAAPLSPGEDVLMIGHNLVSRTGDEVLVPVLMRGSVNVSTPSRAYVKTAEPSVLGMCGGPVIDAFRRCSGIVEALVPRLNLAFYEGKDPKAMELHRQVEGDTVCVTSWAIQEILDEVESEQVPPSAAS